MDFNCTLFTSTTTLWAVLTRLQHKWDNDTYWHKRIYLVGHIFSVCTLSLLLKHSWPLTMQFVSVSHHKVELLFSFIFIASQNNSFCSKNKKQKKQTKPLCCFEEPGRRRPDDDRGRPLHLHQSCEGAERWHTGQCQSFLPSPPPAYGVRSPPWGPNWPD